MSGPASDIDYRTNPRALKWWRLKNHYSQRDVEEKTGVSYTTISRLENGHRTRARFGTLALPRRSCLLLRFRWCV